MPRLQLIALALLVFRCTSPFELPVAPATLPPAPASVSPASSHAGRTVTVRGSNLRGQLLQVSFGSVLVRPSSVADDGTWLTAQVPEDARIGPGDVEISVTSDAGTAKMPGALHFLGADRLRAGQVSPPRALAPTLGAAFPLPSPGRTLVLASARRLGTEDVSYAPVVYRFDNEGEEPLQLHGANATPQILDADLSPGARRLAFLVANGSVACAGGLSVELYDWDLLDAEKAADAFVSSTCVASPRAPGAGDARNRVALSSSGKFALVYGGYETAERVVLGTAGVPDPIPAPDGYVFMQAVALEGDRFGALGVTENLTDAVVAVLDGTRVLGWKVLDGRAIGVAGGAALAAASGRLAVADDAGHVALFVLGPEGLQDPLVFDVGLERAVMESLAFDGSGAVLAVGSSRSVTLWDVSHATPRLSGAGARIHAKRLRGDGHGNFLGTAGTTLVRFAGTDGSVLSERPVVLNALNPAAMVRSEKRLPSRETGLTVDLAYDVALSSRSGTLGFLDTTDVYPEPLWRDRATTGSVLDLVALPGGALALRTGSSVALVPAFGAPVEVPSDAGDPQYVGAFGDGKGLVVIARACNDGCDGFVALVYALGPGAAFAEKRAAIPLDGFDSVFGLETFDDGRFLVWNGSQATLVDGEAALGQRTVTTVQELAENDAPYLTFRLPQAALVLRLDMTAYVLGEDGSRTELGPFPFASLLKDSQFHLASPGGTRLYWVTGATLFALAFDPDMRRFGPLDRSIPVPLAGVAELAVSADGETAYVVDNGSDRVFAIQ